MWLYAWIWTNISFFMTWHMETCNVFKVRFSILLYLWNLCKESLVNGSCSCRHIFIKIDNYHNWPISFAKTVCSAQFVVSFIKMLANKFDSLDPLNAVVVIVSRDSVSCVVPCIYRAGNQTEFDCMPLIPGTIKIKHLSFCLPSSCFSHFLPMCPFCISLSITLRQHLGKDAWTILTHVDCLSHSFDCGKFDCLFNLWAISIFFI